MHALADFLNHGLLPFTGRSEQLAEMHAFWRSAIESTALRMGLVVGEAGSGKSSLMEALIPMVAADGGVAVHVKLYPDAALSLAPLVARALAKPGTASGILRQAPEENSADVSAALRRLTRLRPTLLVVEDIHLLADEALAEFSRLLQSLADEPLGVLCPARPFDPVIQGALERYVVREWHLQGLDHKEMGQMWVELFGTAPDRPLFESLYTATLGNPLALRSALRGVLKTGALVCDQKTNLWHLGVPRQEFDRALERSVRLLSEGMAAHLSEEERRMAERLACLGEVFSREAAGYLTREDRGVIERLIFKGILVVSETPSRPLTQRPGNSPPLSFTHTLIHRRFAESAMVDTTALVEAIAAKTPLYSVLPFQLIVREDAPGVDAACETVMKAVEQIKYMIPELNNTADWRLNDHLWKAAERIVQLRPDCWGAGQTPLRDLMMISTRMTIEVRNQHTDEYYTLARRMLELSRTAETEAFLNYRLRAYGTLHSSIFRRTPDQCIPLWNEVEELLGAYPHLRYQANYLRYLARVIDTSGVLNYELFLRAQARAEELIDSDNHDPVFRTSLQRLLMPMLLLAFENREQFEKRLQYMHELEHGPDSHPNRFLVNRIGVRLYAGRLYELSGLIDGFVRWFNDIGEIRALSYTRVIRLFLQAVLGPHHTAVEPEVDKLLSSSAPWNLATLRENLTQYIAGAGILRGDIGWAVMMARRIGSEYPVLDMAEVILFHLHDEGSAGLHDAMSYGDQEHKLADLLKALLGEEISREQLVAAATTVLREDVYELFEVITLRGTLEALQRLSEDQRYPGLLAELGPAIADMLGRRMEWLAGQELWTIMAPLLEDYGGYLGAKEKKRWLGIVAGLRQRHQPRQASEDSGRVKVSMIGTIQVEKPGTEPQRLRGPRVSKFLGMLVADRMLSKPLSFREMCRLISGGENDDPERERKALNDAVYRLREVLGYDAVVTEREVSRLNNELVEVDLLNAHRLLQEADAAIREGALARALNALVAVLDLSDGEVPFPGLYESFFEAARVEFEVRIRGTLIGLADRLLEEGDASGAEELLRRGFATMPEDEEIMERLCQVLERMGRLTEAVRVRMRASEASD